MNRRVIGLTVAILLMTVGAPALAAQESPPAAPSSQWERTSLDERKVPRQLFMPTSGAVLVSAPGLLLRSDDAGNSWQERALPPIVPLNAREDGQVVAVDPAHDDVVYASGREGLLKSLDGGATWDVVYSVDAEGRITEIAVSPADSAVVYLQVVPRRDARTELVRTTDGGATWAVAGHEPEARTCPSPRAIVPHLTDPLQVFALDNCPQRTKGLWQSADRGQSWKQVFDHAAHIDPRSNSHFLGGGFAALPGRLYLAVDIQVVLLGRPADVSLPFFRSDDDGLSWTRMSALVPDPAIPALLVSLDELAVDPSAPDRVYVIVSHAVPVAPRENADVSRVMASADGGLTWTSLGSPVQRSFSPTRLAVSGDGRHLYMMTDRRLWRLPLTDTR